MGLKGLAGLVCVGVAGCWLGLVCVGAAGLVGLVCVGAAGWLGLVFEDPVEQRPG